MAKKSDLERRLDELSELHVKGVITGEEYQARRAAIVSGGDSQTVVVKKGGFPFFRVGCLGIIVLLVIVVIAAVAAAGGDDDSSPAVAGQVGTNKGDVHVPLTANSAGTIAPEGNGDKKSKITVLQVMDDVKSTNQFEQPAAGKKFWGVQVTVEDAGTAEVTSVGWKLRDSKDIEHDVEFVVAAGEELQPFYNLTPGGKVQGWVYFEIDADASPKWLRADPNPFLKNDLYFDVPGTR